MLRRAYIEIAAFLLYLSIVIINKTLRITIIGTENYYELKKQNKNIVFIFWHQATFIPLYHYRKRDACILTMSSVRGEVLARAGERMGYVVTRLDKEDDAKNFREMIKCVKEGRDSNIAVDGPEGPIYKMKPGAVFLAKKLGRAILPIASYAKPGWLMSWRWDKYLIPLPFSKALIIIGDPIDPANHKIGETTKKCEETHNNLTERAKIIMK